MKHHDKENVETKKEMLKHMFKRILLIHIENRVDPGRFKPGGLTRFNLTHFLTQPVGLTLFKLTRFSTRTVQPVEPPSSNRVSKHYVLIPKS